MTTHVEYVHFGFKICLPRKWMPLNLIETDVVIVTIIHREYGAFLLKTFVF